MPTVRIRPPLQAARKLDGPAALFLAPRRPAEELYDLEADPHEIRNLAAVPEQKNTLLELGRTLDRWIRETGDQGETPEKTLPAEYKYRAQVDGWCTKGQCLVSRAGGALRVECSGKANEVQRSYVADGGRLSVRFRVRSKDAVPKAFSWGAIEDMTGAGNRLKLDVAADGQWKEQLVPFEVSGSLASLRFDFEAAEGFAEFDWIRLYGNEKGEGEPLAKWEFA